MLCDLKSVTSNNPHIYKHDALNSYFCGLQGQSDLQMTSEVTCDVIFELSVLNNLRCHALLAPRCNIDKWLGREDLLHLHLHLTTIIH